MVAPKKDTALVLQDATYAAPEWILLAFIHEWLNM